MKIKAIPFMTAVKNWAAKNNKPFFTWNDQQETILSYLDYLKN